MEHATSVNAILFLIGNPLSLRQVQDFEHGTLIQKETKKTKNFVGDLSPRQLVEGMAANCCGRLASEVR
jgi:hypothetical protein